MERLNPWVWPSTVLAVAVLMAGAIVFHALLSTQRYYFFENDFLYRGDLFTGELVVGRGTEKSPGTVIPARRWLTASPAATSQPLP
jgi:hypothetical protein